MRVSLDVNTNVCVLVLQMHDVASGVIGTSKYFVFEQQVVHRDAALCKNRTKITVN